MSFDRSQAGMSHDSNKKRKAEQMGFSVGLALLAIGLSLAFLGRERRDGTSIILTTSAAARSLYPVTCLGFITFGLALLISGL
jgi:predicted permease